MNALQSFDFEGTSLRVFGNAVNPLFVAADICKAIGIQNTTDAIKSLAPFERTKVTVEGREINAVNESGLYTLILRSRDAVKEGTPAYRFRIKVTAEILPAIRKTGRYEVPAAPQYIDEAQQRAIQREVGRRAAATKSFAAVYRALKDHFHIPRYTCLLAKDFDEAIKFIQTCQIPGVPALPNQSKTGSAAPQRHGIIIYDEGMDVLQHLVYDYKYHFRREMQAAYDFLLAAHSPLANTFWDAFDSMSLARLEALLTKFGYDPKDLPAYKALMSPQA